MYEGAEKYGVVGTASGDWVPFAATGGVAGRQRQPAAGQVIPAPSCVCVAGARNGLLANSVLGRLPDALTVAFTQLERLEACAHEPWT